jgi:hypothetical protein
MRPVGGGEDEDPLSATTQHTAVGYILDKLDHMSNSLSVAHYSLLPFSHITAK